MDKRFTTSSPLPDLSAALKDPDDPLRSLGRIPELGEHVWLLYAQERMANGRPRITAGVFRIADGIATPDAVLEHFPLPLGEINALRRTLAIAQCDVWTTVPHYAEGMWQQYRELFRETQGILRGQGGLLHLGAFPRESRDEAQERLHNLYVVSGYTHIRLAHGHELVDHGKKPDEVFLGKVFG